MSSQTEHFEDIGMRIHYVSHASSDIGSHRMRVLHSMALLRAKGHSVTLSNEPDPNVHWNIFSKHFKNDLSFVLSMRGVTKTAFDIVDDHFSRKHGEYYKSMCDKVDLVMCNSQNLYEEIQRHTFTPIAILKDPINFPYYPPQLKNRDDVVEALWFGHKSNLPPPIAELKNIKSPLTIIVNAQLRGIEATVLQWREDLVEERINQYDVVLLPLDKSQRHNMKKSTNRAIDALHAGRFVITTSEEVYSELAPYIFIGDIAEGITWFKKNRGEALNKIIEGQRYVREHYSDKVLAHDLNECLQRYFQVEGERINAGTLLTVKEE